MAGSSSGSTSKNSAKVSELVRENKKLKKLKEDIKEARAYLKTAVNEMSSIETKLKSSYKGTYGSKRQETAGDIYDALVKARKDLKTIKDDKLIPKIDSNSKKIKELGGSEDDSSGNSGSGSGWDNTTWK